MVYYLHADSDALADTFWTEPFLRGYDWGQHDLELCRGLDGCSWDIGELWLCRESDISSDTQCRPWNRWNPSRAVASLFHIIAQQRWSSSWALAGRHDLAMQVISHLSYGADEMDWFRHSGIRIRINLQEFNFTHLSNFSHWPCIVAIILLQCSSKTKFCT